MSFKRQHCLVDHAQRNKGSEQDHFTLLEHDCFTLQCKVGIGPVPCQSTRYLCYMSLYILKQMKEASKNLSGLICRARSLNCSQLKIHRDRLRLNTGNKNNVSQRINFFIKSKAFFAYKAMLNED